MDVIANIISILENEYLKEGRKPSISPLNGTPQYKNIDGNKCSIGILFDDSIYQRKFEGETIRTLLERFPDVVENLQNKGLYPVNPSPKEVDQMVEFLSDVQTFHDVWLNGFGAKQALEELKQRWASS